MCAGFPSVGKSTLMTKLTGTASEAAAYEFTTLTAVPGITRYNGARIQMLDLPGIIEGAADGKGRGRQARRPRLAAWAAPLFHLLLPVFMRAPPTARAVAFRRAGRPACPRSGRLGPLCAALVLCL